VAQSVQHPPSRASGGAQDHRLCTAQHTAHPACLHNHKQEEEDDDDDDDDEVCSEEGEVLVLSYPGG